ncbi:MAG: endonuclease/exonuclease/phosphatase family protein [Pseudomonadota bacterium]
MGVAACAAAALLVVAGFLPAVHRAADVAALLRPMAGLVAVVGVVLARPLWLRLAFGAVGVAGLATVAATYLPQRPGGDLRVYSKNVWFANRRIDDLAVDIVAAEADVVLLQEVSAGRAGLPGALAGPFPHQHRCQPTPFNGIVVASRHPFDGPGLCSAARAVAAVPIRLDGRRVWIASIHLPWPWPKDSGPNDDAALALLSGLDGPVVLGGDFNAFPWTGRIGRAASAAGLRLAGPTRWTYDYDGLPLPIDAVLAPGGGAVEARPFLGSDHRGLVADISLGPLGPG